MGKLISSSRENIIFTVTDMLRGKCMFDNVSDIKSAVKDITEKAK